MSVKREGVHILALAAKPAPAAAMPASPLDASKAKGELSCRTSKDPRCSIIFMPRIKVRPGRIGKSSYGLRLESCRLWMLKSSVTPPPFWLPSTIEVALNGRNSPFNRKQPTVGANYLLNKGPFGKNDLPV